MKDKTILASVGCGCVTAIVVAGLVNGVNHALAPMERPREEIRI